MLFLAPPPPRFQQKSQLRSSPLPVGRSATANQLLTRTLVPVAQRTRRSGGFALPQPHLSQPAAPSLRSPVFALCAHRPPSLLGGHGGSSAAASGLRPQPVCLYHSFQRTASFAPPPVCASLHFSASRRQSRVPSPCEARAAVPLPPCRPSRARTAGARSARTPGFAPLPPPQILPSLSIKIFLTICKKSIEKFPPGCYNIPERRRISHAHNLRKDDKHV